MATVLSNLAEEAARSQKTGTSLSIRTSSSIGFEGTLFMESVRGQTSIGDVAAQSPNVTLRPQPQNGGSGLIAFIRGVGQTDFNFALEPGVGIYVDDVYIPTLSSSLLDLMDLGSGLVDHSQKMTVAARVMAEKKAVGQRS